MNKRILGGLAAAAMVAGGLVISSSGVAQAATEPSSCETAWNNDMNKASYWSDFFGMTCTEYSDHGGNIPATYDAAVIKDGAAVVKVYPDPTNVGAFTAIGAINPSNGRPYGAPHSWVMKCDAPDAPQTQDPKVVYTEWVDGDFECGDMTVEQTRDKSTTTYTWNGEGFTGETKVVRETQDRDLTEVEQDDCPTTPPSPPTPETEVVPPVVVEQLPPPTKPAAEAPTEAVFAALPPAQAPTTTARAPVATIPAAGLPATGSNGIGVTALIALLVTSLGGAALLGARRRNVTT